MLGGPKEREARKVFSKGNEGFQKGGFRTYPPENGSSNDFNPHKGRGNFQKGGFRTYPPENGSSNDFNPHKGRGKDQKRKGQACLLKPSEEGHGYSWESDDWYSNLTYDSSTSATGWYGTEKLHEWHQSL